MYFHLKKQHLKCILYLLYTNLIYLFYTNFTTNTHFEPKFHRFKSSRRGHASYKVRVERVKYKT